MAEPLVFLPGMMCDVRVFLPQITKLSRNFPIHVASLSEGNTIEELSKNVLENTPPRFSLVGSSLGGMVAMDMLRRAPDRIEKAVLISVSALAETPAQAADREELIVQARSGRLADAIAQTYSATHLAPGPQRMTLMNELTEMAASLGPQVYLSQSRAMQRRPDQQASVRKTSVPTCLICGEHDDVTPPKHHAFIADLMGESELHILPDAGHMPTLESPDSVTEILEKWFGAPLMLN